MRICVCMIVRMFICDVDEHAHVQFCVGMYVHLCECVCISEH